MKKSNENTGIGFFEKYLTVWVILCMVAGILIGRFLPEIPQFLNRFEYAQVSIPIAVLIWLMIYPMMMKVDFQSIRNVGKNPKGLLVTWVVNWLIKLGIFLLDFQPMDYTGIGKRLSGRCGSAWSCAMHGDGIRLESSYQRQSGLYRSSSRNKRLDYSDCIHSDSEVPAWSQ